MSEQRRAAVLEVEGMTSDDCARHVGEALASVGAGSVSVSWRSGRARFEWPEQIAEDQLRAAGEAAGYRAGTLEVAQPKPPRPLRAATRWTWSCWAADRLPSLPPSEPPMPATGLPWWSSARSAGPV